MNFYVDSGGAILGVDPEKIYQGSANANTIRFVGAFASNVKVTVAFKLPTGVWTTPQLMTASTQLAGVVTSNGVQFNVWEYSIPALVTETFGTVNMQFYVYGDAGNGNGGLIATASSSFQVERGVPITLPDPTDDYKTLLTQILSALSQIEGQIPGMEEDITGLQSKVSDLSEDKLDKQSGATAYEEAYVKDTDGSQKMERVTITSIASAIVKRDANGNINIAKGLSGNPKNGANMENIADVEEKISKCPTLAGDNDFTGINRFIIPITIGTKAFPEISIGYTSMTWRTDANTFYTYSYPTKSGTFALTSDIPTDYATQTALANTQRQVDGLYTLLEQKNEIYVQTATDTYTTRETAGGENIADGVQTPVKKITGKTVKTTNLMPYPYTDGMSKTVNGVTFTVNTDGAITINGTATGFASFIFSTGADKINFIGGMTYYFSCRHGIISYLTEEGGEINYIFSDSSPSFTWGEGWIFQSIYIQLNEGQTENNLTVYPMLNEGSTALPYMPYFPGLKNAFFKEIVSTGRNLIPFPYATKTSTIKGVTFTINNDGTVNVNGTATDGDALFYLVSAYNLSLSEECYFSGCPAGGSSSSYLLQAYTSAPKYYSDTGSGFLLPANIDVAVVLIVRKGFTANNLVFKPILNYGSSALPYEPYTQSVLSLPEAVELTEYDTAYPETGEIQRQSETDVFNGTEMWNDYSDDTRFIYTTNLSKGAVKTTTDVVCNLYPTASINGVTLTGDNGKVFTSIQVILSKSIYPNLSASTAWKSQLAAWNEAGNPLTVTYKTAEATTEQADFSADSYIAWKNGSETIKQGDTDNSEYGAENTVEQDYYLLTAPQEVTKE